MAEGLASIYLADEGVDNAYLDVRVLYDRKGLKE